MKIFGLELVPEINVGNLLSALVIIGAILKSAKGFVDKTLKTLVDEQIAPIKQAAEDGARAAKEELPKINTAIEGIQHDVGELKAQVANIGQHDDRIQRLENAVFKVQ